MKVAIDSGPIAGGDSGYGMGTYVRELVGALKSGARASGLQIEQVDASKTALDKFDLVHLTKFRPFFLSLPVLKPKGVKFILTIYDLIPLIYPKHYPPGIRGWLKWQINKFLIRKNIDAIITISETSKKDICRFIGINPEKVFVTHLAAPAIYKTITNKPELERIRKKYKLPSKFALSDTDVYYSKNVPNLIKAARIAKIPLVIVNKNTNDVRGRMSSELDHPELRHLKNVDWDGVTTLGPVPFEDIVKIYNLATVYVQPSFYEGFGLPLIQAIACKVPVVATKTQCLVELLGSSYSFVDPSDPKAIAWGIQHPNKDKKLPRIYSWQKTANETVEIYNKTLK